MAVLFVDESMAGCSFRTNHQQHVSKYVLMKQPLTKSSLFFLNLCNDYRALQNAKAKSGVTKSWLKQDKTATFSKRQNESDDGSDTTSKATPSVASKPIKKRILNSGVAVVSQTEALASKPSSKKKLNDAVTHENMEQGAVRYGGLEDEADNKEWETIQQSPVKGKGVRKSDAVHPTVTFCLSTAN
jgi:hypothetical protein